MGNKTELIDLIALSIHCGYCDYDTTATEQCLHPENIGSCCVSGCPIATPFNPDNEDDTTMEIETELIVKLVKEAE